MKSKLLTCALRAAGLVFWIVVASLGCFAIIAALSILPAAVFVIAGNTMLRPLVYAINRIPLNEKTSEATTTDKARRSGRVNKRFPFHRVRNRGPAISLVPQTKAVIDMTGNDKRRLKLDFMIACSLFAAGVVISGVSIAQIRAQGKEEEEILGEKK